MSHRVQEGLAKTPEGRIVLWCEAIRRSGGGGRDVHVLAIEAIAREIAAMLLRA
jgi:hypothetical protein